MTGQSSFPRFWASRGCPAEAVGASSYGVASNRAEARLPRLPRLAGGGIERTCYTDDA